MARYFALFRIKCLLDGANWRETTMEKLGKINMNKTPEERQAIVHRGIGRVMFLAHLEAIQKGVDEGWPLTALYEKHKGELVITYSQFARYVSRYIRKAAHAKPAETIQKRTTPTLPESSAKSEQTREGAGGKATQPPPGNGAEQPRFEFDPKSPDRDSLV
jgi:hypothetical protein